VAAILRTKGEKKNCNEVFREYIEFGGKRVDDASLGGADRGERKDKKR